MVEERESFLYFNNAKGTTFGSLDEENKSGSLGVSIV